MLDSRLLLRYRVSRFAEVLAALKGRCAIHTSTHGKGYHCRLELDKPVAMSGHEYTTYSNQCIAQLGEEVGLDLPNLICGKNILWIWSKSQTSDSFSLISEQTIPFSCDFSNSTPKMWESPTKISVKPDIHGIAKACGERPTLKELRETVLASRGDYLNKRANWFRVLCVIKRLGDYDLADEYSKLSNCYDPVELLTTGTASLNPRLQSYTKQFAVGSRNPRPTLQLRYCPLISSGWLLRSVAPITRHK